MKITYATYMAKTASGFSGVLYFYLFTYLFIYLFIFWNGQNMLTPEKCGRQRHPERKSCRL